MREEIAQRAKRAIEEKVFPGCVIGLVARNGERRVWPFGSTRYEGGFPVKEDTIYDVASITKSIPTASLALRFIEAGKMTLDDLFIKHVPEFANNDRDVLTIRHLLTYTVGGYALAPLKDKTPQELYEAIMHLDFTTRPGTGFLYSNVPAFLLGLAIERVGGHSLENLARTIFFDPLHMERTSYVTDGFLSDDIAPSEIDEWRGGEVHGVVHDESAYVLSVKGGKPVGHAGLFSCVPDLLTFLEMLLCDGEYKGDRYFLPESIAAMSTNQLEYLRASAGLGWQLHDKNFMGAHAGEHTFGKTGFTGTAIVCDKEKDRAFAILSNRTYPRRPPDDRLIRAFRQDIADLILA